MASVTFSINAIDKTRAVFASVDASVKRLSRSTSSLQGQFLGAGLGVLGAGSLFVLLGNQVRDLIRNIDDIPGIPEETRQSVRDLKADFEDVRNFVLRTTAAIVGFVSTSMKSVGSLLGALDLKDLLNPMTSAASIARAQVTVTALLDDEVNQYIRSLQEQTKQEQAVADAARNSKLAIEAKTKAQKEFEDAQRRASRIIDQNRTATEKFNQSIAELKDLLARGLLDKVSFDRELERLKRELAGSGSATGSKPSAPLTDQFTRIGFLNDRGTSANEAMQSEAKKQTNLLQTIADTLKKGMAAPRREIYGGAAILT